MTLRPLRHVDPQAPRGAVTRTVLRLLGTRPVLWFERTLIYRITWWRVVPRVWRLTGRLAAKAPLPVGLLETTDTRNGRPHRRVLIYFHDGDKVTLVATTAALPRDPSWYDNALASPHVRFAGQPFRAEPIEDAAELKRLWPLADRCFPPFAAYRARARRAGREIPILQLSPR